MAGPDGCGDGSHAPASRCPHGGSAWPGRWRHCAVCAGSSTLYRSIHLVTYCGINHSSAYWLLFCAEQRLFGVAKVAGTPNKASRQSRKVEQMELSMVCRMSSWWVVMARPRHHHHHQQAVQPGPAWPSHQVPRATSRQCQRSEFSSACRLFIYVFICQDERHTP